MSEFINDPDNSEKFADLEKFNGKFVCERIASDYTEQIELKIDYVSNNKVVNVTEISTIEDIGNEKLDSTLTHEGWAVCTGNGFYLIVLHNQEKQSTKCYLILQSAPSISRASPLNDIALISYESAWTSELSKSSVKINDSVESIEYSLPQKTEDLCLFFTRV